jgi:hypothetical protein
MAGENEMITFHVQTYNGNYYRGHEPSNSCGNCWCGDAADALVFTIEQARDIAIAWPSHLNIVISMYAEPIPHKQFKCELFCAKGGSWYEYKD